MAVTDVHTHGDGVQCYNRWCSYAPETIQGVSRCRCKGYPATTLQGDCTVCGAGHYESDADFRAEISGGFVETNERVKEINTLMNMDTDNFPVSLICYRGEKAIPVLHVRMDSIRVKESTIPGYVNVEYEAYSTSITGTVPMVDYYTTESE